MNQSSGTLKKSPTKFERLRKLVSTTHATKNGVYFHCISQFTATFNDNLFKFLTIFLLISLEGASHSNAIVAKAGAIYVLPFLLFSSLGGMFADRWSKQRILLGLKMFEVVVTAVGVVAFYTQNPTLALFLLFLLSFQSALMGPPKYSIIPELVIQEKITEANGWMTATTYMAAVFGSVSGGLLSTFGNGNYVFGAVCALLMAGVGFIATWWIPKTAPIQGGRAATWNVLKEVFQTLKRAKETTFLAESLFGSSFFLFVAGFVQMNIIPFAMNVLGRTKELGSNIFLLASIGIAVGSWVAGKMSKRRIEIGLSPISGICSSLILLFIPFFPSVGSLALLLFLLGFFGGMLIVPFESFSQTKTPVERRGQMTASGNFLGFSSILLATLAIYFFEDPNRGFYFVGILDFAYFFYFFRYMSREALHLLARFFLRFFCKVERMQVETTKRELLFYVPRSWLDFWLLSAASTQLRVSYICERKTFSTKKLFFSHVRSYDVKHELDEFLSDLIKEESPHVLLFETKPSLLLFLNSRFSQELRDWGFEFAQLHLLQRKKESQTECKFDKRMIESDSYR